MMECSEKDFLKMYFRNKINSSAINIRKKGISCRDKDFTFPKIKKLDSILEEVGIKDFFNDDYVVLQGLTSGDYTSYISKFMTAFSNYSSDDNLLGRGWRN